MALEDKYLPCVLAMDVVVPCIAARGGGAVVTIVGIAAAATLLVCASASYLTGAGLSIDGGASCLV